MYWKVRAISISHTVYKKQFFCKTVLYTQKAKKPNPVYVWIFLKPKYWELSWALKLEFCFFETVNNSIAKDLWSNLLDNREKIELFLVHDTIQWLNWVVHYLNVKINWKLVEKTNAQLWSALKWERM